MNRLLPVLALFAISFAGLDARAQPNPRGVGLGVAAGVNLATADEEGIDSNTSFSWGFFVDIPLLETFYITPAAMVYEIDPTGENALSLTDIDLNFKFIVPLGAFSLGVGVTAGLTTGLGSYEGHFGGLGYLGWNLVSNLDLFVLAQYKRLPASGDVDFTYNNIHVFGGGMFRF